MPAWLSWVVCTHTRSRVRTKNKSVLKQSLFDDTFKSSLFCTCLRAALLNQSVNFRRTRAGKDTSRLREHGHVFWARIFRQTLINCKSQACIFSYVLAHPRRRCIAPRIRSRHSSRCFVCLGGGEGGDWLWSGFKTQDF